MFDRKTFAARLKMLLKETGASQQALADALDIRRPTVTQYCSQSKQPNMDRMVQIADFFDVSIDYLACRTDNRKVNR